MTKNLDQQKREKKEVKKHVVNKNNKIRMKEENEKIKKRRKWMKK